ncbi:kinase-like domain-containing protein [Xylariaceae sp. FL0662B]|nr:kinase-like domain-containing protein [Xylariaceae sp. FL0662B]
MSTAEINKRSDELVSKSELCISNSELLDIGKSNEDAKNDTHKDPRGINIGLAESLSVSVASGHDEALKANLEDDTDKLETNDLQQPLPSEIETRDSKDTEHTLDVDEDEESESGMYCMYWPMDGEDFEEVEKYRKGGYHPVHIGDILDGRYEVVAKLGQGGFATVWLSLETQTKTWRAIKILTAKESSDDAPDVKAVKLLEAQGVKRHEWEASRIALPIDQFWVEGPNGRHICFVQKVFGPRLIAKQDDQVGVKKLFLQAAEALQFLHKHSICHGDFRTSNILVQLQDIDHITKDEMIRQLGEQETEEVASREDDTPGPNAPNYLVAPANLECLGLKDEIIVVDFGVCFHISDPPQFSGIPLKFAAPEAYLEDNPGFGADLWSFICTIVDVRMRSVLFGDDDTTYIQSLECLLGPLPERFRMAWARQRGRESFADVESDLSKPFSMSPEELQESVTSEGCVLSYAEVLKFFIGKERHHLRRPKLANGELDMDAGLLEISHTIPTEEVPFLTDLFHKILKYDPKERIDIDVVVAHDWFKDPVFSVDEELPADTSLPIIAEPRIEPAESLTPPQEDPKPTEKSPEATQWRIPGREKFRRVWDSIIHSRVVENFRSVLQWQVFRSSLFPLTLGFTLGSVLWAALLTSTFSNRSATTACNLGTTENCHKEFLLIPTTVESSTSIYFQGEYGTGLEEQSE